VDRVLLLRRHRRLRRVLQRQVKASSFFLKKENACLFFKQKKLARFLKRIKANSFFITKRKTLAEEDQNPPQIGRYKNSTPGAVTAFSEFLGPHQDDKIGRIVAYSPPG
jgi:hypothetical protein